MKYLRALLITTLIIVMGTVSAFADVVSLPRMIYDAKWYIVAAIVIIIIAISLLRSVIRHRAQKSEAEIEYGRYENMEALEPLGSAREPQFSDIQSDDQTSE